MWSSDGMRWGGGLEPSPTGTAHVPGGGENPRPGGPSGSSINTDIEGSDSVPEGSLVGAGAAAPSAQPPKTRRLLSPGLGEPRPVQGLGNMGCFSPAWGAPGALGRPGGLCRRHCSSFDEPTFREHRLPPGQVQLLEEGYGVGEDLSRGQSHSP